MGSDEGMDAYVTNEECLRARDEWRKRALAAEHGYKVVSDALKAAQERLTDEWTPWDRYAAAALTGLLAHYGDEEPSRAAVWAGEWADNMMGQRKERAGR